MRPISLYPDRTSLWSTRCLLYSRIFFVVSRKKIGPESRHRLQDSVCSEAKLFSSIPSCHVINKLDKLSIFSVTNLLLVLSVLSKVQCLERIPSGLRLISAISVSRLLKMCTQKLRLITSSYITRKIAKKMHICIYD
jgi:hypothetical protein